MVKLKHSFLIILFLTYFMLINGCNVDLLGLFYSTDLDERLKERNNTFFVENLPVRSISGDYQFIVLSDSHFEDGKDWGLKEKLKEETENNTEIKFVVFLGDITQYGAKKDLEIFIDITKYLSVPCYPVIGNHEIYFGNWSVWKNLIGSTRYRIDDNDIDTTLFILDSANSFFGKEQLDWLQKELKTVNKNVFVFTHSPLFVSSLVDNQQITNLKERARIVSMLSNKCDIMFMGHAHKRFYNDAGGVQYIAIEDYKDTKVYLLVTVSGGSIGYEFKKF